VPGQQRARRDQAMAPQPGGQQPGQRGQDRPVGPVQPRPGDLTAQNRDLVAEDQDLGVLRRPASAQQEQPAKYPDDGEVQESDRPRPRSCLITISGPNRRSRPTSSSGAVQALFWYGFALPNPAPARAGPRRAGDRRVAAVAPLNHPGELGGLGDLAFLPPVADAAAGEQRSSSARTTSGLRLRGAAGRQSASSRPRIAAARRCGGCWQRQRQHRTPRSARPGEQYRKGIRAEGTSASSFRILWQPIVPPSHPGRNNFSTSQALPSMHRRSAAGQPPAAA
jgi:hypothetical protein